MGITNIANILPLYPDITSIIHLILSISDHRPLVDTEITFEILILALNHSLLQGEEVSYNQGITI